MLICLFKKTSTDLEGVGVRTPPSWKIQTCLIHIEIIPKINIPLLEKILTGHQKVASLCFGVHCVCQKAAAYYDIVWKENSLPGRIFKNSFASGIYHCMDIQCYILLRAS